jgi:hypothetical protein
LTIFFRVWLFAVCLVSHCERREECGRRREWMEAGFYFLAKGVSRRGRIASRLSRSYALQTRETSSETMTTASEETERERARSATNAGRKGYVFGKRKAKQSGRRKRRVLAVGAKCGCVVSARVPCSRGAPGGEGGSCPPCQPCCRLVFVLLCRAGAGTLCGAGGGDVRFPRRSGA